LRCQVKTEENHLPEDLLLAVVHKDVPSEYRQKEIGKIGFGLGRLQKEKARA